MKKILFVLLIMCLMNSVSFSQKIKYDKWEDTNSTKFVEYEIINNGDDTFTWPSDSKAQPEKVYKQVDNYYITKTNFIEDYGVLITIIVSLFLFLLNKFYVYNKKKKQIHKIKKQLLKITIDISTEINNVENSITEIDANKGKRTVFLGIVPGTGSIKLNLMYSKFCEIVDGKDLNDLDELYFINSKFKNAINHLIVYLNDNTKLYDLFAAKGIIVAVKKEISMMKNNFK